ncbi:MAG: hypothetical protein MJZ74_01330 [Muribaculaceae bacterium]|nr:hypothetical protein [Muribaculaceae bacterium]
MRLFLNIILAILISFNCLAVNEQNATVSAAQDDVTTTARPTRTRDGKQNTPVPAAPKKEEKTPAAVPPPQPKNTNTRPTDPTKAPTNTASSTTTAQPKGNVTKVDVDVKTGTVTTPGQQGNVTKVDVPAYKGRHYDGIDISRHQKNIDWDRLATDKNVRYVYIKATEGTSYKDPKYAENLNEARRHKIPVGAYHFMRTGSSVDAQFAQYTSVVKKEEQDLLPMLDVEVRQGWTNQQMQDSVMKFCDLLEKHYGCKPLVYTNAHFYHNVLNAVVKDYPLFIARYASNEPTLSGGTKWILWQFSDKGRLPGIDVYVDLSCFNKGYDVKDLLIKNNPSKKYVDPKVAAKEEAAKKKAEEEARKKAEEEAKKKAKEEEAAKKKGQEAKPSRASKAEKQEAAKKKADEEAKKKAEEEKKAAEKKAKEEAAAKKKAEEAAKKKADEEKKAAKKKADEEKKAADKKAKEEKKAAEEAAKKQAKAERDKKNAEREQKEKEDAQKKAAEAEQNKQHATRSRGNKKQETKVSVETKADDAAQKAAAQEKAAQEEAKERAAKEAAQKAAKEKADREEAARKKAAQEAEERRAAERAAQKAQGEAKARAELEKERKEEASKAAADQNYNKKKETRDNQKAAAKVGRPERIRTTGNKSTTDNDD